MRFQLKHHTQLGLFICAMGLSSSLYAATASNDVTHQKIEDAINSAFQPLMKTYDVPGMAVGVIYQATQVEHYAGLKARNTTYAVDANTLFELGSVSKLFTATAGSYAVQQGKLSLNAHPGQYWPELNDRAINQITLLDLATYTTGHLGLQFPEQVNNDADILKFYQEWQAKQPMGQYRQYSNPSIGLFGELTARAMQVDFSQLLEHTIFPKLGLKHSYVHVPTEQRQHYAYGYDQHNSAMQVTPGPLDAQAYGVKSSLPDMLHFLDVQMNVGKADPTIQHAILATHTTYFKVDGMAQGLAWEVFDYPASLKTLQDSNSKQMVYESNRIAPMQQQFQSKVLHKTGATNGFGSYVVVIPEAQFALVMLMNKRIPNEERIQAAYQVFKSLQP